MGEASEVVKNAKSYDLDGVENEIMHSPVNTHMKSVTELLVAKMKI